MRYYLGLFMSLFALAISAQAVDSQVLLIRKMSGGNPPPAMRGWASEIVLYQNGDVYARYLPNSQAIWEEYKLVSISPEMLSHIKADLVGLSEGEIIVDENQPACFDLPITRYKGVNAQGEEITFAVRSQCQDGYLANFSNAWRLKGILDGQAAFLSYLP